MYTGVMRVVRVVVVAVAVLLLGAWGTLSEPIHLDPGQEDSLRYMIDKYGGADKGLWLAQLDDRGALHPIHQFIVYQAYLLLKDDPAYADNQSGLPTGDQINTWDGVERIDGFMVQRPAAAPHLPGGIGPTIPGYDGPSADAERTRDKGFNKFYNGRAHYWNPWLQDGEAPTAAGENFSLLVHSIVEDDKDPKALNQRAHFAAYMAHYVADVTSAKHADAFTLDGETVLALARIAEPWAKGNDILDMLADPQLDTAEQLLRDRVAAINPSIAPAYWQRIEKRIPFTLGSTIVARGTGPRVDIPHSSLRTAAACYLHGLGKRPPAQRLDQFFTYFDPLYFNGPIVDPIRQGIKQRYAGDVIFQMCTGFSEHLQWESNPAHFKTVMGAMAGRANVWDASLKGAYVPFKPQPGFFSSDAAVVPKAMKQTTGELVKWCSKEAHGDIASDRDFGLDHEPYLRLAIRCVYTAFRASITALRVEAFGRRVGDTDVVKLALNVRNLAAKPATLRGVTVSAKGADGKFWTQKGWRISLDKKSVAAGDTVQIRMKVTDVPTDAKIEDMIVDVRGEVADTPDSGWRRAKVEDRDLTLVRNPEATTKLTGAKGPIDVIVVIDTTGSMQNSIDNMRKKAIASIKKLREQSTDIRLAVTTFRDLKLKQDVPHFKVKPFTTDLEAGFAFLNGLVADSGGDTAEDQLHGISLGLALWEKEGKTPDRMPTKVIVVVTDAPAHSPDSRGNTFKSIAKRAYAVDPAHIYPIIVGSDPTALAHAQTLAEDTGGKVLQAATGDDVADAVLEAVETAAATHAPGGGRRPWALTGLGILAVLVGAALIVFVMIREHHEEATHA